MRNKTKLRRCTHRSRCARLTDISGSPLVSPRCAWWLTKDENEPSKAGRAEGCSEENAKGRMCLRGNNAALKESASSSRPHTSVRMRGNSVSRHGDIRARKGMPADLRRAETGSGE